MSVLKKYFDKSVNQASTVKEDVVRKVNYDEDEKEIITYEKIDYKKFQESLGTVDMWSLDALLNAGVDPAFPIHTGLNTRLEGIGTINDAAATLDRIMAEDTNNNKE